MKTKKSFLECFFQNQKTASMIDTIKNDLTYLLNTHPCQLNILREEWMLEKSILTFGLINDNNYFSSDAKLALKKELETLISIYEPRISNIKITLLENKIPTHTCHIQISGQIKPSLEFFSLHSNLDPHSGLFYSTEEKL